MDYSKRLFLFAGFDKDGIVDDALIYYVSALSKYGDVIVCMDCNLVESEINKLKPYTIAFISQRHGEYDFGSYKRAYIYAAEHDLLKNYDVLYLVNDSVFGPMFDISKTLQEIETKPTDACGIVVSKHKTHAFMESWFVRLNQKIFMSDWFDNFIRSVKHEKTKAKITIQYEHGLTNVIAKNNCSWSGIYIIRGRETYNRPKSLFKKGCPFVKKVSFTRHNGSLGAQIKYILKHSETDVAKATMITANRVYGKEYTDWLLTSNPIKILYRSLVYGLKKLKSGTI